MIVSGFKNLSDEKKELLANISSPLKLVLAILYIAKEDFGQEYLSIEQIIDCIEASDNSIPKSSISNSISRANNKISSKIINRIKYYKITIHGKNFIEDLYESNTLRLVYVEANTPRTALKNLSELFTSLKGNILICDPYYGARTFYTLELIPKETKVFFLTARTSEKIQSINSIINDFKKEHTNFEIREVQNPKEIHDRYIIDDGGLMLVGHGIKDIGNKDSFIIKLDKTIALEVWNEIKKSFSSKWSAAKPLP